MNEDKETAKVQIRQLSKEIREATCSEEASPCEWEIARIIIEYSARHNIKIPLIDYVRYARRDELREQEELEAAKPRDVTKRRRKLDEPEEEEREQPYEYFDDFLEAIGEEGLINPRFTLHPEIRELVECWEVGILDESEQQEAIE